MLGTSLLCRSTVADLSVKYKRTPLLISTVVMFQAQNRETINSIWKVAVSFKIFMTTSVTRPCFTRQHQICKTKIKTDFWSQTGLVLRPTVSDNITTKNEDKSKFRMKVKILHAKRTAKIRENAVAEISSRLQNSHWRMSEWILKVIKVN